MTIEQYLDILEASFIAFVLENFGKGLPDNIIDELEDVINSKTEQGFSAEQTIEFLINRNLKGN